MTTDTNSTRQDSQGRKIVYRNAASNPVYGLGLIGAWIYFIGHATTFWMGVLGVLKGIVWPTLVVIEVLKYFKM